jgi:hypothetical protein
MYAYLHTTLVLRPSCVPEKAGVNRKFTLPSEMRTLAFIKCSNPQGVKPKMREGKLVGGVKLATGFRATRA